MPNRSDYDRKFTDLFELLPEVFKSDTNKSLFSNLYNRFLTKDETVNVNGTIGTKSTRAVVDRQIQESSAYRQLNQLEPLMYTKIGTVDHIKSWLDVLKKLETLGVNIDKLDKFLSLQKFNWVPPIDIDKLLHYSDYYWLDVTNLTAPPQYLTIKNYCNIAETRQKVFEKVLVQYGDVHPIVNTNPNDNTISVTGNKLELFATGAKIFINESANNDLNNTWFTVDSAEYTGVSNRTTLTLVEDFTLSTVSGQIDLNVFLDVIKSEKDCLCSGVQGWDVGLWDDNNTGPIVTNDILIGQISHATLIGWNSDPNNGVGGNDIWYSTSDDVLYQYFGLSDFSESLDISKWKAVSNNFSVILDQVENNNLWDYTEGCDLPSNPWITENKWIHKSGIGNFAVAKQAQLPIIEYDATLELNSWVNINHVWEYRGTPFIDFEQTNSTPSKHEMLDVTGFATIQKELVLPIGSGDLTEVFIPGYIFSVSNSIKEFGQINSVVPGLAGQIIIAGDLTSDFQTTSAIGNLPSTVLILGSTATLLDQEWSISTISYSPGTNETTITVGPSQVVPVVTVFPASSVAYQTNNDDYVVASSEFRDYQSTGDQYQTVVTIEGIFNIDSSDTPELLYPKYTSLGDLWTGYNNHWLYVGVSTVTPVHTQFSNIFNSYSSVPYLVSGEYEFTVSKFGKKMSVINLAGLTTFSIEPEAVGPATTFHEKCLVDSDDIRIYVDDIRQYGNYTLSDDLSNGYVTDVTFDYIVNPGRQVRIDVGAAAMSDIGLEAIEVRTSYDDLDPLETKSLTEYQNIDQLKTQSNQYPLFDNYFASGEPSRSVNSIFKYQESADYKINLNIGMRVVQDDRDYSFKQELLSVNDGPMTIFRDYSLKTTDYWFNDSTNTLYEWSGSTWINRIKLDDRFTAPVYSSVLPINPPVGTIVYNIQLNLCQRYNQSGTWDEIDVVVNNVDPTLQSIWKKGLNDEEYRARYVNRDDVEVPVGSVDGDWELPEPYYYNVHHENRVEIQLSELVTHFDTIIHAQTPPPGFPGSIGQLFNLKHDVNYGLGGTIREYNDNLDILLSSLFVDSVTTETVIDFAKNEYSNALISISEEYVKSVTGILISTNTATVNNLPQYISDSVISSFETNTKNQSVYDDSNSYIDGVGVKNFISTLPMLGFYDSVQPVILTDKSLGINEIVHHDGHLATYEIPGAITESIYSTILQTPDTRLGAGTFLGNTQQQFTTVRPQTNVDFMASYSSDNVYFGKYWFETINGHRTLFRFDAYSQNVVPTGDVLPGSYWYDTATDTLKQFINNVFSPVTVIGDGIISAAWIEIDLDDVLTSTILNLEQKLFDVCPVYIDGVYNFEESDPEYTSNENIEFNGYLNDRNISTPYTQLGVFVLSDPYTWNYNESLLVTNPNGIAVNTKNDGAFWKDLYFNIYRTPYPHLEPWILQGYTDKPDWWDAEYKDYTETRNWVYDHSTTTGMWENIRIGHIPNGRGVPNVPVPTYSYMSVNIDDISHTGIAPDGLLPPFWDWKNEFGSVYTGPIKSLYDDLSSQVAYTNNDYIFGVSCEAEYNWRKAVEYKYDMLNVAYRLNPVKFMSKSFGLEYYSINSLDVDSNTDTVHSHWNELFHNDIYDGDKIALFSGINQWYVNYNRFNDVDLSASKFRDVWKTWKTQLAYQFNNFIDGSTLEVYNNNFDITDRDTEVLMKKSPAIDDIWIDSLNIKLLQSAPSRQSRNTQSEWKFELSSSNPIGLPAKYFGVKKYKFNVHNSDNIGIVGQFPIASIDINNNSFEIAGYVVTDFRPDSTFSITDSTVNNGTWTVSSVKYIEPDDKTVIKTIETIDTSSTSGNLLSTHRILNISTGDMVKITSSGTMPLQLLAEQDYYIIKTGQSFELAASAQDAIDGISIPFDTHYTGQLFVGKVKSSFYAFSAQNSGDLWFKYDIDENNVEQVQFPTKVFGLQNTVDMIFGYAEYLEQTGVAINDDLSGVDPLTGRIIGWQLEVEKLIDWAFVTRNVNGTNPDYYNTSVDSTTDEFIFIGQYPIWQTGTKITIDSDDGGPLPSPLVKNIPYFLIRDSVGAFKLAKSKSDAIAGVVIDITDSVSGLIVHLYSQPLIFPEINLNPFTNDVWVDTPTGIISHIVDGPYEDIRSNQTIYDQYGRLINLDSVNVLRLDTQCKISVVDGITNDVEIQDPLNIDPTNYIHLGGLHLYVDGYEHVLMFSGYNTGGFLIYDPYIGLNTPRFEVNFNKQKEVTFRPNVGGAYMLDGKLSDNIENSVNKLRNAYSTYTGSEKDVLTQYARGSIGYDGTKDYLNDININDKSQFVFWRGMIQNKGTTKSTSAFINSRRFIDAKIDEYWAYKVGEFGSTGEKFFPAIKLTSDDSLSNELKINFSDDNSTAPVGFETISNESDRWLELPLISRTIDSLPGPSFSFSAEICSVDNNPVFVEDISTGTWVYVTEKPSDDIIMTYFDSTTNETIKYDLITKVNSRTFALGDGPGTDQWNSGTDVKIYSINVSKSTHNALELIDTKSKVVTNRLQLWDPAKGCHYYNAARIINITCQTDPAKYEVSTLPSDTASYYWSDDKEHTVWFDESDLYYVPYSDEVIYPNISDRVQNWGKQADFSEIKLYQWTRSPIHPSEWNDAAVIEEGDKSINQSIRKTGRVLERVYKNTLGVMTIEENKYLDIPNYLPLVNDGTFTEDCTLAVFVNGENVDTINFVYTTGSESLTFPSSGDYDSSALVRYVQYGYDLVEDGERVFPTQAEIDSGDYVVSTPYSSATTINDDLTESVEYFFWVTDKTIKIDNSISLIDAKQQLTGIPVPYAIVNNYATPANSNDEWTGAASASDPVTSLQHGRLNLGYYNHLIVRGLSTIVNDDDRYKLQLSYDESLRDHDDNNESYYDMKNLHEEWALIRQHQVNHIPRNLWDLITESIIGYRLADNSIRVPSIDSELFDALNGTATRIGIGKNQQFVEADTAITNIMAYLNDSTNDFSPADINSFLLSNSFDTPESTVAMMDNMYNSFTFEHVNAIFFDMLNESLVLNKQYSDLFKTSMVSIHGIRILEVDGTFD